MQSWDCRHWFGTCWLCFIRCCPGCLCPSRIRSPFLCSGVCLVGWLWSSRALWLPGGLVGRSPAGDERMEESESRVFISGVTLGYPWSPVKDHSLSRLLHQILLLGSFKPLPPQGQDGGGTRAVLRGHKCSETLALTCTTLRVNASSNFASQVPHSSHPSPHLALSASLGA